MNNFTLPADYGIHGQLLSEEINAALGLSLIVDDVVFFPPNSVEISGLTPEQEAAAQAVVDAHDPIIFRVARDGDDVTVIVSKPNNVDAATELTLTIDDTPLPESTPLINNAATVQIESADEITIGILENYRHPEVTV
jgi:hypothetical protein